MAKPVRKSATKNPPILSHEFIIQNHADIVSCVAMIFVIGLLVPSTAPLASIFISLQHNVTEAGEIPFYTSGIKDWAAVFFYSLICIVIQAIIQEYVLDKISKKFHLSKSKLAVFNASGQLAFYYCICNIWGLNIIFTEKFLPNISNVWSDYPAAMSFMMKLFLITQISYALHEIPELYFLRTKKEEYAPKTISALLTLVTIAVPYFMNFNRLLICLVFLHYVSEFFVHLMQVVQTLDKDDKFSKLGRFVSLSVMVATRITSIILATLTLWFGLSTSEPKELDIAAGYFNVPSIRLALLAGVIAVQLYFTCVVTHRELQAAKESSTPFVPVKPAKQQKQKAKKGNKQF
ncbi:translocating chain-associated membrane protein 1 isoform X2 [Atheta coriaria]|uniref:translocating chain-associated membrane protein 1 isoform X2 n=1 Tax=Dalotia coriaria TaxID=877792 RepID=UPI0031F3B319